MRKLGVEKWLVLAVMSMYTGAKTVEWKDFFENRGMRVNMNKTKVMISGEWQKVMQKAIR